MTNEHKLPYTAEEIDERLRKAGDAVLCTPQTLTEEQQAQARANIGAASGVGLPYFALTATTVNFGDAVELADEDKVAWFSILEAMALKGKMLPLVVKITMSGSSLITVLSAAISTEDFSGDLQIIYCGNIWLPKGVLSVELGAQGDGSATIKVSTIDISGADTEAIAAELEAVIDGEY